MTNVKEQSWAHLKYSVIADAFKTKGDMHGLEIKLFQDYLESVPDYLLSNERTWASVIVGFEPYSKKHAIHYAGSNFSQLQNKSFGTLGATKALQLLTKSFGVAKSAKDAVSTYNQAVIIMRDGPQIFNKSWYEEAFGKPPLAWAEYYPGWTPFDDKK